MLKRLVSNLSILPFSFFVCRSLVRQTFVENLHKTERLFCDRIRIFRPTVVEEAVDSGLVFICTN